MKRFFRIIPIYFFVVAIYFLLPFFRDKEALPPLWKFLTFTQNFGTDSSKFGTFSHVWSLCVKEHFYLFFPFILIFLQRKSLFAKSYWILIALLVMVIMALDHVRDYFHYSAFFFDATDPRQTTWAIF